VVNGGTIQNKGFEVTLHLVPVKTPDFLLEYGYQSWSRNRNKVISLYNNQPSYIITKLPECGTMVAVAGKSTGILRGSGFQYLNGKPLIDTAGNYCQDEGVGRYRQYQCELDRGHQ